MRDERRGPRVRNNKKRKNRLRLQPFMISFSIVISICLVFLLYKEYEKIIVTSMKQEEQQRQDTELYLLFQSVDKTARNLVSETDEDIIDIGEMGNVPEDVTIKIVSVGDILCETSIYEDAYNKETGEYDFSHIFSDIKKYTLDSNLTLGLLETNFVENEEYSGNIKHNSPKAFASALKDIGINILYTASNHSLDYGFEGLRSTIDCLEGLGFTTVGTYRSEGEASRILVKDVEGIKLAFLSYTYGMNSDIEQVSEKNFCVNVIEREKIKKDISKAKAEGVDFVFVHTHWGDLASVTPNKEQKELADFLFENGADFVLGSHPASLQPMEIRTTEQGRNVFIAYSTGNFISASKYTYSNIEMILNIEITKIGATGETSLSKVTYVPVYLLDNGKNSEERYKLLDMEAEIRKYESGDTGCISQKTYKSLKESISTIERLVGKEAQ